MNARLTWLFFLTWLPCTALASSYTFTQLEVSGAQRTSLAWLRSYLQLEVPTTYTDEELEQLAKKLRTTDVFTNVVVKATRLPGKENNYILKIELAEKWTTIPVIRGAFGGGTPLAVLGLYDTHSFGSLWTLGAEMRKYGSAKPGGVAWARAPRWLTGKHYVNLEFWHDNRIRSVYDRDYNEAGRVNSQAKMVKAEVLHPIFSHKGWGHWQLGLGVRLRAEEPATYEILKATYTPSDIEFNTERESETRVMLKLVYDSIEINQLNKQGIRFHTAYGPNFGRTTQSVFESELFYFQMLPFDINFALHAFVGSSTGRSLQNLYFLGGFDSVRGLPDGVAYGNKMVYLNSELRMITLKARYVWLQNAIFYDAGSATMFRDKILSEAKNSAGLGIRFSIPQVYRLVFRIDYAWSLDGSGAKGISAGMNQFFQPYRPL